MTSVTDFPRLGSMSRSPAVRILILFLLLIVLLVPIFSIDGLIGERRTRKDTAVEEVASKWGRRQTLMGPVLVVPYVVHWTDTSGKEAVVRRMTHAAVFLPERVTIRGRLHGETRRRGIFSVPVYRTHLDVSGVFTAPSFADWGVASEDILWDRSQLVIGLSDTRAIEGPDTLQWNGAPAEVLPGPGDHAPAKTGIHADVHVPDGQATIAFSAPLDLRGSDGAYWTAVGKTTAVRLDADWPNPSFQGGWLPRHRTVGPKGFEAEWSVPYLGRNIPQRWQDNAVTPEALEAASFGVDLVQTVDHYRMTERSVKYAILFLLLTFAAVWLVEVLCRIEVHPIQYLLLGAALCVFYLLELSLSEHLGFGVAYLVATLAIVGQVAGYSRAVLKTRGRAAIVAGVVAMLYGYLYVVLTNEDYALLIGAVGVFAMLGVIMYLTRRVDWSRGGALPSAPEATPPPRS